MVFLFVSFSFARDDLLRRMLSLLQETICFAYAFSFSDKARKDEKSSYLNAAIVVIAVVVRISRVVLHVRYDTTTT